MSFKNLRKRTKIDELVKVANQQNAKKSYTDDRIWKPQKDKTGNGFAIVRFLPAPEPAVAPWVQYWDYGFKGSKGWYIEKSRKSLGPDVADPVAERYFELINSNSEADKEDAKKLNRRLHFVSNVYIVKDTADPSNEGKVMLYDYGKTIHDKIIDAMKPEFEDDEPLNPFDMWEGADFKIKIRTEAGWSKYDKSEFANSDEFLSNDDEREEVYNKLYDITEFIDEKSYKSYEELKKKLERVLNLSSVKIAMKDVEVEDEVVEKTENSPSLGDVSSNDEDEDMTSYFKQLAQT